MRSMCTVAHADLSAFIIFVSVDFFVSMIV